jgi:hypothetical protein
MLCRITATSVIPTGTACGCLRRATSPARLGTVRRARSVEGSLSAANLTTIKSSLEEVATFRAENGAQQSRLGFATDLLTTNKANLEAANSRIVDVDVAEESTALARSNILVQAGTAMCRKLISRPNPCSVSSANCFAARERQPCRAPAARTESWLNFDRSESVIPDEWVINCCVARCRRRSAAAAGG